MRLSRKISQLLFLLVCPHSALRPLRFTAAALPLPNVQKESVETMLESSLKQILANTQFLVLSRRDQQRPEPPYNYAVTFPLPCNYLPEDEPNSTTTFNDSNNNSTNSSFQIYVQESTTSLLTAKALAKTVLRDDDVTVTEGQQTTSNNAKERYSGTLDNMAWDMLDAALFLPAMEYNEETAIEEEEGWSSLYFQTQGLLPKYWYIHAPQNNDTSNGTQTRNKEEEEEEQQYYLKGTRFPHWSLFSFVAGNSSFHSSHHHHHASSSQGRHPRGSSSSSTTTNHTNQTFIQSSHRLSALPLHASILWDMLCAVIPPQNDDDDDDDSSRNTYQDNAKDNNQQQQQQLDHNNKDSSARAPYSYNYDHNKNWWNRVERYYDRIYQNHVYLHEVVMRGCRRAPAPDQPPNGPEDDVVPCYNILHPWESLMDPTSPTWRSVLQPIVDELQERQWTLPFDIPPHVREAYDFPGGSSSSSSHHVYEAMVYLLVEGWNRVNVTQICRSSSPNDKSFLLHSGTTPSACGEDAYWNHTQTTKDGTDNSSSNNNTAFAKFAMLDVGYAAILAQADADLHQLARVLEMVLPENFYAGAARRKLKRHIKTIEGWQTENRQLLEGTLWDARQGTYQSKVYNATSGQMEFVDVAVSNNLIPFWYVAATRPADYRNTNSHKHGNSGGNGGRLVTINLNHDNEAAAMTELARQHWKDLSLQLLRRDDRFAFDCGPFPLWSQGCAQYREFTTTKPPIIQPIVNYLIANGLLQNDDNYLDTFGRYISTHSLQMIGSTSNTTANTTDATIFGEAYSAFWPYQNLATLDTCGKTSTLTAAITYNLVVPDPSHVNRLPLPPIRRSWVITLITVELFMAFSIGVSCLLLSFSLLRKTRLEDDGALTGDEAISLTRDDVFQDEYVENGERSDQGATPYYDATAITSSPGRTTPSPERNTEREEDSSFFSNLGLN